MTPAELIAAEEQVVQLWRDGEVNAKTHFSGSVDGAYEKWMCDFFAANIKPTDWVMASHRCHYAALLHGMPVEKLKAKVVAGKSMFIYGPRFICSAIVAGSATIGAGLALAAQQSGSGDRVFCFLGDGATDEGAFTEAVRFVDGRDLPCTFIVENNDSSCGVTMAERGMKPFQWPSCVVEVRYKLRWPHAGNGERPVLKRLTPA